MNVVIVANGQDFFNDTFKQKVLEADCIIAADGGIYNCIQNGVFPDYLISDIDSSQELTDQITLNTKIIRIDEQETTDVQKALAFTENLNPKEVNVFCSFGKRTDHTLGNIIILNNYDTLPITMYDASGSFKMLKPGKHFFKNKTGRTISLFCFQPVEDIKLFGFKYPLNESVIGPVFFGVSNEVSEKIASIKFTAGRLLVYERND